MIFRLVQFQTRQPAIIIRISLDADSIIHSQIHQKPMTEWRRPNEKYSSVPCLGKTRNYSTDFVRDIQSHRRSSGDFPPPHPHHSVCSTYASYLESVQSETYSRIIGLGVFELTTVIPLNNPFEDTTGSIRSWKATNELYPQKSVFLSILQNRRCCFYL